MHTDDLLHVKYVNYSFQTFANILAELPRREKETNIKPDPDIDIFMKFSSLELLDKVLKLCFLPLLRFQSSELLDEDYDGSRRRLSFTNLTSSPCCPASIPSLKERSGQSNQEAIGSSSVIISTRFSGAPAAKAAWIIRTNMAVNGIPLTVRISAFIWLLSFSYGLESDIYCLESLKKSLEDPFSYLSSSWIFTNKTEGFICKFTGIDCWHPDESKVLNIRLSDMGLKGKFPLGLRNCTALTGLDLSSNKLSGTIPPDISQIISYVTSLDLSSNDFSGEIPQSLSNCSYLNILKLDNNQLTGQIPPQLGLLSRLKTFSVTNNHLTGQVPNIISATAADYSNNTGLCGKPLPLCPAPSKSAHPGVIVGAAIGGVSIAALGVGIGMIFFLRRVSKKKKEDDPLGNKWAKSIKGAKGIKAS
ncbi:hypothetical protein TEA_020294 [Camellia sinensis var. sinensis]|uniref:Leucine-rich repeat-containing N-terminal plant-type domain-containing protein n=1 Tax=Camellia sinensis var. sinensis TaxID=542762 RepID=A0A4S4DFP3_CAMSN|nr:hypothetical protein TEA_020294 [Camellia sinensis var. sinensis]